MRGNQTNEVYVAFPALDVWNVYSTLILPEIIRNMPNFVKGLKVTRDGSVGTTFDIHFAWGTLYLVQGVTLDQECRVKEVKVREGGVLTLGFISFKTLFEIIEKGVNLTTIKNSIIYEINDAKSTYETVTTVSTLIIIAKSVVAYLQQNAST